MKKLIFLIIIAVAASAAVSGIIYFASLKENPEKIALAYYKAIVEQDVDRVYDLLSQKDREVFTKQKLSQLFLMSENTLVKSIGKEITARLKYRVLARDRNAASATVRLELEIQIPDLRGKLEELLKILFSGANEKSIKEKLSKKIGEMFKTQDLPYNRINKQFVLVKEKDHWKITFGNLKTR